MGIPLLLNDYRAVYLKWPQAGKTYQLCISIVKHHYCYYYIKNEETSEIVAKQRD